MTKITHIRIKDFGEVVGHYEAGNRLWPRWDSSFEDTVQFEGETEVDFINAVNEANSRLDYKHGKDSRFYPIPIVDEMKSAGANYGDVILDEYHVEDEAKVIY